MFQTVVGGGGGVVVVVTVVVVLFCPLGESMGTGCFFLFLVLAAFYIQSLIGHQRRSFISIQKSHIIAYNMYVCHCKSSIGRQKVGSH